MKLILARYEVYPKESPTGYVVAFQAIANNGREYYTDIIIPFLDPENRTDEQVIAQAYDLLKDSIYAEITRLEGLSSLLGKDLIECGICECPCDEPTEPIEE
jgi:hypothetical protein